MTNIVALSAYPIYDKNNFDSLVEINNVFQQTKSSPMSNLNIVSEDPWRVVTPDGRFKTNEYSEDVDFEGIGQFQSNGNRHYNPISYQNYVDSLQHLESLQFLDMKGTGIFNRPTGVIAPKKFIKVNKKTGKKYVTKDILNKY